MSLPLNLFLAVLFGAVIGLERQASQSQVSNKEDINGIRTYSLISLLGGIAGAFFALGMNSLFLVVAAGILALIVSYYIVGSLISKHTGLTTEISMVFTFVCGFLTVSQIMPLHLVLALVVVLLLVLSLKSKTGEFILGFPRGELQSFISYAVIALVVLPFLPNQSFKFSDLPGLTEILPALGLNLGFLFGIEILNPRKLWFVVALITGIDIFGYVLAKMVGQGKSFSLASFVGGFISSTSTTQALAQKSRKFENANDILIGAAVLANLASFFQIFLLVSPINSAWLRSLSPILVSIILSASAIVFFFNSKKRSQEIESEDKKEGSGENIFSLFSALKFAVILTSVKIITKICLELFGQSGFLISSMIASFAGIDAIIINLAEMAGKLITFKEAAFVFVMVNATNLLSKSAYSFIGGSKNFAWKFLASVGVIIFSSLLFYWWWF